MLTAALSPISSCSRLLLQGYCSLDGYSGLLSPNLLDLLPSSLYSVPSGKLLLFSLLLPPSSRYLSPARHCCTLFFSHRVNVPYASFSTSLIPIPFLSPPNLCEEGVCTSPFLPLCNIGRVAPPHRHCSPSRTVWSLLCRSIKPFGPNNYWFAPAHPNCSPFPPPAALTFPSSCAASSFCPAVKELNFKAP